MSCTKSSNCPGYYSTENVGSVTAWTNFNYPYPRCVCVQYFRNLYTVFFNYFFHNVDRGTTPKTLRISNDHLCTLF